MFMTNKQLHWLHWLCLLWTSNGHLPMQRPKGHATCSGSPCFCCPTLFFDLPWPTSKMMALWGRGCIFLQKTAAFRTLILKPLLCSTLLYSALLVQHILGLHHIVGDQLDAMRQGWIFSHPCNGSHDYCKCEEFSCDPRRGF